MHNSHRGPGRRDCDQQFNERSDGVLNRASLPSDMPGYIASTVLSCLAPFAAERAP